MQQSKRYKKIKKIGEGAFGNVYKAIDLISPIPNILNVPAHSPILKLVEEAQNVSCEDLRENKKYSPLRHPEDVFPQEAVVNINKGGEEEEEKGPIQYIALKKIKMIKNKEGINFIAWREIKFLEELDHPNIVKLYDVTFKNQNMYLSLEFVETDLEKVINNKSIKLTEPLIKSIMLQIVQTLHFLHKQNIMHRDIKPGNMLLSEKGIVKFADFGLARKYSAENLQMTHGVVTRWYRPPEILYGSKNYGPSVDIWSLGCLLGELMLREPLFPGSSEIDQLTKIFTLRGSADESNWPGVSMLPTYMPFSPGHPVPLTELIGGWSVESIDLLDKLIELDPSKRPTTEQILLHAYFTKEEAPILPQPILLP